MTQPTPTAESIDAPGNLSPGGSSSSGSIVFGSAEAGGSSPPGSHNGPAVAPGGGAPGAVALTDTAARGFAWLLIEAFSTRAVTFFGQILLARILLDEHWGLVGMAFTVATFADFAATSGLKEVLIQRQRRFKRWSNAGVWMSIAMGCASAGLMMAVTPLVVRFYGEPELVPLLIVLALNTLAVSPGMVPEARLRSQLRFRAVGLLGTLRNAGAMVLSVIMALAGFGALSFVVPRLIMSVVVTIAMWVLATPPVRWELQARRWWNLLGDSTVVFASTIVLMIMANGGLIALGRYHDASVTGQYYFAYNLSLQTAIIFGLNFAAVLFPALNRLNDDQPRQLAAFNRSARVLAILGVPVCLVQAAVAAPAVNAVFGAKWEPAIPVLQILSIGMAPHVMWNSTRSLLLARGRFRINLALLCIYAAVYLAMVIAAARWGAAVEVAFAVALCLGVIAPIDTYIALRTCGGGWANVLGIYGLPFALSTLTIGPTYLAFQQLPEMPVRDWVLLLGIPAVSLSAYAVIVWRIAPDFRAELLARLAAFRRRRGGM